MIIKKETYDLIDSLISGNPPETGGIIGSAEGNVIDNAVMDISTAPIGHPCSYAPNVDFLNENIEAWQRKGIGFKGVFHTHLAGVETLSCADKHYIDIIMKAMPDEIGYLFFPVFVLPSRKMVCYRATPNDGNTTIIREQIEIIA